MADTRTQSPLPALWPDGLPDPRIAYWGFEQLQRFLAFLAEHHTAVTRVERLGSSGQGRPLYLVKVGRDLDVDRPALWLDANMHASEVLGVNVCASVILDLIALHAGDDLGLSAPAAAAARSALVYVVPTLSPDGLSAIADGRFVRSTPDPGTETRRPRWRQCDIDGDGQVRRMRVLDACGAFVESKAVPGLMLPRGIDDEGPYYCLYPEGTIDDWDGSHVPSWDFFDDAPLDLNRNFSFHWRPEPEQAGAGAFAGSSPEAQAVLRAATARPHIYAWLNLHCFGGVWIRPLGDAPDSALPFVDRAVFGLVEDLAQRYADLPTVSGFEQFTYVPEKPLRGDLVDYAFMQRGAYAWAVELWDLFEQAGLPRPRRFVDRYTDQRPSDLEHLARALAAIGAPGIEPWRKATHPQLGDVEVGGFDPRFSVWNPPPGEHISRACRGHGDVVLRMLSLLPRLRATTSRVALGPEMSLLTVTVENVGGLPTSGPQKPGPLPHNEPVRACLVDEGRAKDGARRELGHLGGVLSGRFGPGATWPYQNTEGLPARRRCTFVIGGDAPVTVRVGSVRTGFIDVSG